MPLVDPEVRAVIALLGGCGSLRLLPAVDVHALQRDPKPLVGFSDITALHRVWQDAGVASLHGCVDGAHADEVRGQLFGEAPAAVRVEDEAFTAPLTTRGRATGATRHTLRARRRPRKPHHRRRAHLRR